MVCPHGSFYYIFFLLSAIEGGQVPKHRLKQEEVQLQKGGTDCGLFAIANLIEVLYGSDPTMVTFKEGLVMRQHYYDCLDNQYWLPFPRVESVSFDLWDKTKPGLYETLQFFCGIRSFLFV